jgi:predicted nucleic acid-binding protein
VALKWFLPENGNSRADDLLRAFLGGTVALYAPDLLLIEVASAIYRDLLTLPLNVQPSERLAAAAFSLALAHRHSAYDAVYCALSVEMDCEFITADRKLVAKLGRTLPYIRHISTVNL